MPKLTVDGASLGHRTTGEGPPLVLVHGSGTDSTTWDGVLDDLARDFAVTVYDRRGYGRSTHAPVRDHRIHARDLAAVLEQVVGRPAVVVGWSSGGNIALATAVDRPELFASLVVVEAPLHGLRHPDRHVLATAARLKLLQARGRKVEAAEVFFRFGSALRSGGNSYDNAPEDVRQNLRAHALPVLAEWDPHPFGVMRTPVAAGGGRPPGRSHLGARRREFTVDGGPVRARPEAPTGHPHRDDRGRRSPGPPRPARTFRCDGP